MRYPVIPEMLFLFFVVNSAFAGNPVEKTAIVFGGNCDEGQVHKRLDGSLGPDERYSAANKFLPEMVELSGALVQSGWKTKVLYDSQFARCTISYDHPACFGITHPPAGCCEKGITPENWSLNNYEKAGIDPKEVGFGSKEALVSYLNKTAATLKEDTRAVDHQVLLLIDTHGRQNTENQAHGICLSNGVFLPMNDPALVSALKAIKAASKNKFAIMDDSCFGGGSIPALQAALGDDACLLSSQASGNPSSFFRGLNNYLSIALKSPANKVTAASVYRDALAANLKTDQATRLHQPQLLGFSSEQNLVNQIQAKTFRENESDTAAVCKTDLTGVKLLAGLLTQLKAADPTLSCNGLSESFAQLVSRYDALEKQENDLRTALSSGAPALTVDFKNDPLLSKVLPFLPRAFQRLEASPDQYAVNDHGYTKNPGWSTFFFFEDGNTPSGESELLAPVLASLSGKDSEAIRIAIRNQQNHALEKISADQAAHPTEAYRTAQENWKKLNAIQKEQAMLKTEADSQGVKLNLCLTEFRLKQFDQKAAAGEFKACADFKFN